MYKAKQISLLIINKSLNLGLNLHHKHQENFKCIVSIENTKYQIVLYISYK